MTMPRLLLVEDEALIALDLQRQLTRLGYTVVGSVDTGAEAIRQAADLYPDLVLMDIQLKGPMDGIEAAAQIRLQTQIPVVFLTAHADQMTLQRVGVTESSGYVLKPFDLRTLHTAIELALYRHQAERRQESMERWLATTLQSIGDGVLATDLQGRINFLNPVAERLTGWPRHEALGRTLSDVFRVVHEATRAPLPDLVAQALIHGAAFNLDPDAALLTKDGHLVPIDDSVAPIRADDGQLTGVVVICRDRTERQRLELERHRLDAQLQASQKLESLGVLAGGIAHDFNNLLMGVMGHAELCQLDLPDNSPLRTSLRHIVTASERAAALCKQMLAYAGQGAFAHEPVQLNPLTTDTVSLVRHALSPQTQLHLELAPTLPPVQGDPSQLQQVMMNLVLNAAEALKNTRGDIRLRTGLLQATRASLATAAVVAPDLPDGPYVFLEVADTGCGMDPDTLAKIFDPFFTTKFSGRGLGLAAALGIVRTHRGALQVESTLGHGSTFRVLLPPAPLAVASSQPAATPTPAWQGAGMVFIVDDEPMVREITQCMVATLGFTPLAAESGQEALQLWQAHGPALQAVLLDLSMPEMDGLQTLRALRQQAPTLPVLLISGYTEQAVADQLHGESAVAFLHKPFTLEELRAALRDLLQGGTGGADGCVT